MKYIILSMIVVVAMTACASKKTCQPCGKTTVCTVK